MQPIFLIGFMGCGKTTLARAMARKFNLEFIDLDLYIENRFRRNIRDIFAESGEEYFRRLEASMLREVGEFENIIVACGGGTPCFNDNMTYMNERGTTVFLDASREVLHRRLMLGRHKRPLMAGKDSEGVFRGIDEGMAVRRPVYSRAKLTFCSDYLESHSQIENSIAQLQQQLALLGHSIVQL